MDTHKIRGEDHYQCREVKTERDALITLAKDAMAAWENDKDMRVGNLLRAMLDPEFRKTYRPDLPA